jgi:endonuclease/exonuclease/phosphatase family metal-dependent hydrolase
VTTEPLVVATFNIRNGLAFDRLNSWPLRRRATAAMLRRLDADVFGLQEAYGFQLRYLQRALPGYAAFGEGRAGGRRGERCPVLVRTSRVETTAHRTCWFGDDPDRPGRLPEATFPRVATVVRCRDGASGAEFDVINTHLDEHRAANRVLSIEQLVTWLRPGTATVVLGDFNATQADEEVFSRLREAGLHPVLPDGTAGTSHGFTGTTTGRRIDHLLVTSHFDVTGAAVVTDPGRPLPSDHWPLRAALRLVR